MRGKLRITNPVLAIISADGHHEAITVPAGSIVHTDGKAFNGSRLMEVEVDGKAVLMFTEDLKANSLAA